MVAEELVLEEGLLDHPLRATDEVGAAQRARRVEVLARDRRPAAFPPDAVHHLRERRERLVRCGLRRLGDEAVRIDRQRGRLMPGLDRRAAMELCEGHEALW